MAVRWLKTWPWLVAALALPGCFNTDLIWEYNGLTVTGTAKVAAAGGQTVQFKATGGDGNVSGYTYSISPSVGSIGASTGLYTPPAAGTISLSTQVTVQVADTSGHTDAVTITVYPGVSFPSPPTLVTQGTPVSVAAAGGSGTLTYSANIGTIDQSGTYSAPAPSQLPATATVTATDAATGASKTVSFPVIAALKVSFSPDVNSSGTSKTFANGTPVTITISGGTPPYTLSGVSAGTIANPSGPQSAQSTQFTYTPPDSSAKANTFLLTVSDSTNQVQSQIFSVKVPASGKLDTTFGNLDTSVGDGTTRTGAAILSLGAGTWNSEAYSLAVDGNGDYLVSGYTDGGNNSSAAGIVVARFDGTTGALDTGLYNQGYRILSTPSPISFSVGGTTLTGSGISVTPFDGGKIAIAASSASGTSSYLQVLDADGGNASSLGLLGNGVTENNSSYNFNAAGMAQLPTDSSFGALFLPGLANSSHAFVGEVTEDGNVTSFPSASFSGSSVTSPLLAFDSRSNLVLATSLGNGQFGFARYSSVSPPTLDTTFGSGGTAIRASGSTTATSSAMGFDASGNIVVVGEQNSTTSSVVLLSVDSSGQKTVSTANYSLTDISTATVSGLAFQSATEVFIAGTAFDSSNAHGFLLRVDYGNNGAEDTTFPLDPLSNALSTYADGIQAVTVDSAGRLVVAGYVQSSGSSVKQLVVARFWP